MQLTRATINKAYLPYGQEVIDLKKKAMKEQVFAVADMEVPQDYHNLAQEILASGKPKQLLASLLQLHFGGHLNPHAYPEIREPERPAFKQRHSLERHGSFSRPAAGPKPFGRRERTFAPPAGQFGSKPFFKKRAKSF